jgi:hypothetical protein
MWAFSELHRQSTQWNPGFIIFSARKKVYPVSEEKNTTRVS